MRPLFLIAALAALAGAAPSAEITKGPLKAGEPVPGSFHPALIHPV